MCSIRLAGKRWLRQAGQNGEEQVDRGPVPILESHGTEQRQRAQPRATSLWVSPSGLSISVPQEAATMCPLLHPWSCSPQARPTFWRCEHVLGSHMGVCTAAAGCVLFRASLFCPGPAAGESLSNLSDHDSLLPTALSVSRSRSLTLTCRQPPCSRSSRPCPLPGELFPRCAHSCPMHLAGEAFPGPRFKPA